MKLILLLSILALVVCDYPPAKPSSSYGPPAESAEEPAPLKSQFPFSSYPYSSFPYSSPLYSPYSSYFGRYGPYGYLSKYQYNQGFKPFSSINFDNISPIVDIGSTSSSVLPPIIGGGSGGLKPPLPLPPQLFPPSLPPPSSLPLPQISTFSSQFLPYHSYNSLSRFPYHSNFLNNYSFSTFPSFPTTFSSKNNFASQKPLASSYGPPSTEAAETPAPAETAEDSAVSYPYEAAASESPDQEYGPPSGKK